MARCRFAVQPGEEFFPYNVLCAEVDGTNVSGCLVGMQSTEETDTVNLVYEGIMEIMSIPAKLLIMDYGPEPENTEQYSFVAASGDVFAYLVEAHAEKPCALWRL